MKLTEIILDNFAPQNLRALWLQPQSDNTVAFKVFNNGMWMDTFEWQDLSVFLTKTEAADTYQPKGNYATSTALTEGLALKEGTFTPGTGLEMTAGRVLNVTFDTTAFATKTELTAHTGNTSNPHNVTKAQVGLGNVDNTSDANKPVSTAQQAAINAVDNKTAVYTVVPELTADYTVPANATTREFIYEIPVGDTVYNITGASGIKWAGGTAPAVQANKTYLIRVIHNLATWTEF